MSPSHFIYYSSPSVVANDKYTEVLTMQVIKPIRPSDAFIGQPGYYEVDDFRARQTYSSAKIKERE